MARAEAQWLSASRSRSHRPRECLRSLFHGSFCCLGLASTHAPVSPYTRIARWTGRTVEQTSNRPFNIHSISLHLMWCETDRRRWSAAIGSQIISVQCPCAARAMFQNSQVRGNASRLAGVRSFWDQQGLSIPHHCCRLPNHMQIVPTRRPQIRRATRARLHRLVS
jgi:hypothetical protein